ncbi:SCARB2 isoform 10 [Pan troglodytes]|uniref:Scavenger receptor class B member 2 n=4 Tax=Homininae TaxID=207598 RepID=A0A1W2PQL5_HUMAN|nr:scavenger receptor class B member 2 [Homo sapiens]KAI4025831.1 scavenger receptor class B member 2 [Homo sapiens]PNI82872.1 SCARB2 isoform 10 [Pan troglodytes]
MGRCCFYTAGTLSLLLLVTSVTLLVARVFQKAVDQSIEKKIVLRNGTEAFDSWEKPPLPVYTQFYFFNVTNPEEILRGETPRVEEVGPYTYSETGDIRTMVFPVMYLNESVHIDKETASRLKSMINTTLIITNIPYIIMALGVFFGLVFTWLACKGQGSMDEGTADERAPLIRT